MKNSTISVRHSVKINGRGVFAERNIKKGETIETCPVILLPMKEFEYFKKTGLYYYFFEYSKKEFAVNLGYGSLYNHSFEPNSKYVFNYAKKQIKVIAIKNIAKDEEIFFNYNWNPDDKTPLGDWFQAS